jgi:hypothetical protein
MPKVVNRARREVVQDVHLVATPEQLVGEVGADETGSSRNQ